MKKFLLPTVAIVVIVGGVFLWRSLSTPTPATEAPYAVPALTKIYESDAYRFSLMMPEDFEVTDIPSETGGEVIVLQDKKNNGVQITITPSDEDIATLTQEMITAQLPDLEIREAQPVEVGENHTGLAFKSNNEAFGGASREVWFVFGGNLYQISTYERLDTLLQAVFKTWQFHIN